jgi:hypothetical protein
MLNILLILSILVFDVALVYRSNRKRKFGIYPGMNTLLLLAVTGLFWTYTLFTNMELNKPVAAAYKKNQMGYVLFDQAENKYALEAAEASREILKSRTVLFSLLARVKLQCFIALGLAILGRILVSRRNNFYHFLILLYIVALGLCYYAHI